MFNWMLGQLRKAVGRSFLEGRSYFRGRAPNLNRLSSVRENAINPHPQPSSVFAQFPVVCMFNWMLGQLRKAVGRSFLEGRSYVHGRAPNLKRLTSEGKCHKPSPSAQFSVRAILSRVYVQLDARPIEEGLWEGRFLKEGRRFMEELRT